MMLRMMLAVVLAGPIAQLSANADEARMIRRAREIVNLFVDGQFDEFVAVFDATMREKFPAEQVAALHSQLVAQLGPFEQIGDAGYERRGEYDAVAFAIIYQRSIAKLDLVLDAQQRLSGFWIRGVESRTPAPAPAYADPAKFTEEPFPVVTGEFELPGILAVPKDGSKHPALVLVHGSGPHDADETLLGNKPFRDLAHGLATRGIAVLRYEKRTHKYGAQMDSTKVTLDDETIDDAVSAARSLRARADIDPEHVYVLGHSLGGLAAPFIATKCPEVAGIILLAGTARSILDVVLDQITYLARADGDYTEEEKAEIEKIRAQLEQVRTGNTDEMTEPLIGAPPAYWARLHALDQVKTAEALALPILIIQGGRDYQVSRACYKIWRSRLGERKNVSFRLYPKLNHLMVAGDGPSTPGEYFNAGNVDVVVIEDIAQWIRAGGKLPRQEEDEEQ